MIKREDDVHLYDNGRHLSLGCLHVQNFDFSFAHLAYSNIESALTQR